MPQSFRLSFRFLDSVYHGRGDGGEPEWPPSPLRVFQALVAAAASRWHADIFKECALPALEWFQSRLPEIVAPDTRSADRAYRLYVPNNAADLVASAWKRGNAGASIAEHRTEKDVRPTHLAGETIHYLYPLPETLTADEEQLLTRLSAAARSVTHLGWGVDMVAADARVVTEAEADKLPGHRWRVVESGGVPLRVPTVGTLADLTRKHEAFLGRLSADGFRPVPPLSCFDVKQYHSATAGAGAGVMPARPFAAFQLLAPDASKVASFGVGTGVRDVAAWVRRATAEACVGWPFGELAGFVHGHDPSAPNQPLRGEHADVRFSYLPLPSVERRGDRGEHVGRIRRVLVAGPPGCRGQVEYVRRRLAGSELVREGRPDEPTALLNLLPTSDWVLGRYTAASAVWTTVTPVLLPGYDDRDREKAAGLLADALRHTGLPPELISTAEVDFGHFGFLSGVEPAGRFARPENLNRYPAYHVRVTFPRKVPGPLAVGAGRYRGLGLFVGVRGGDGVD